MPNRQRHFTAEVDAASGIVREQDGLQRRLSQRQLTMIAIGGAIGVGLFLGSSVTIELAGPGVIVTQSNVDSMQPSSEEIREKWVSLEQIIEAAIFLATPAGDGVNGVVLPVQGKGI